MAGFSNFFKVSVRINEMKPNQKHNFKGLLPRLLRLFGVEVTEDVLFKARVTVLLLCLLGGMYFYFSESTVGNKYGNYEAVKGQLR